MNRVGPATHQLRRCVLAHVTDVRADGLLLVACSGGPDSLALAAAAAATDRSVGTVVVDHGLQPGSAAVAATAAEQCRALGLAPVVVESASVTPNGGGPEAAARTARYDALTRAAERLGAVVVLLAHTMDDQAETTLLALARGSGTRSLAGMPHRRGLFRRPLLGHRRAELAEVLAESGLTPWLDPHNDDARYLRVRVRQTVLPLLERELGPGVTEALARSARLARQDADALDDWATREAVRLAAGDWPVAGLAALPPAVRSRVLLTALRAAGAPATDVTFGHIEAVDRLVTDWTGQGPIQVPGGVTAGRHCGRLTIAGRHESSESSERSR